MKIVEVKIPEELVPSEEMLKAQAEREKAYQEGKRGKDLPTNKLWKEYKNKIMAWLVENIPQSIINRDIGNTEISRTSFNHTIHSIVGTGIERLQLLVSLDELLAEAVVTQVQKPKPNSGEDLKQVYILHGLARINNTIYLVRHVVKERTNGKFYYDTQSTQI